MISKIAVFISAFSDLSKALFLIPPAKISKFSPPPFSREAWVRRRFVVRIIEPWQTCFSAMQHQISRSQVIHLCIMAPLQRGLSMSKKASQSFASADAKALLYVFCRDMCVAENTLRGVSVELSAISGQQRRRTKRFFLEKVAKPLFRQSRPPCKGGCHGHTLHMTVTATAACGLVPLGRGLATCGLDALLTA